MTSAATGKLGGKVILVVEDEYMLAMHLADVLRAQGATVVGPAGSVRDAMALVEGQDALSAAVLDVNLRNERVYPVADALLARGVPIVFATGYEELLLQRPYLGIPRCSKPYDQASIIGVLRKLTE